MDSIGAGLQALSAFLWGTLLIVLLVGGGIYFAVYSRMWPYRYRPVVSLVPWDITGTPTGGLSPHQFMPMSGVHKSLQGTFDALTS